MSPREPSRPAIALVALWVLLGAVNAAWLARDTRPPTWDPYNHLLSAIRYRHALADLTSGRAGISPTASALLRVDDHYPPLAPLAAAVLTAPWPPSPDPAILVLGQLASGLLIAAVYAIGKDLFSPAAGVAAAALVTTFPLVSQQSRQFMLDVPDAAMTSLCILALLRSRRFEKTGATLAFGALFGLALLTKWTCAFFVAAPAAGALLAAFRESRRLARFRHAASAALIAAAIALPWYAAHLWGLARDTTKFAYDVGVREGDPPVFSARSLLYYPSRLESAVLLPSLLLFTAGLILAIRRREERWLLPLLWIAGGATILTLIRNKDARYLIPMLPAVALVAAAPLARLRPRLCFGLAAALAALGLAVAWRRDPPRRENWPIREALAFVRESSEKGPPPRLRVIPDWPYFERHAFEYESEAARVPLDVGSWFRFPTFTDYVLTKTGEQGDRPEPAALMREIDDPGGTFPAIFRLRWEHPLPDGSVARIYAREVAPVPASGRDVARRLQSAVIETLGRYAREVEEARVSVDEISDEDSRRGRFRSITVAARSLRLPARRNESESLVLHDLAVESRRVSIDPHALMREGEIRILALEEIVPRVRVAESDVNAFLAARPGRLTGRVRFSAGRIEAEGLAARRGPHVDLAVAPVLVGGSNVHVAIRRLRVGGVPIPPFIAQALVAGNNPLLKPMPCRVRLDSLRVGAGMLAVNEPETPPVPSPR